MTDDRENPIEQLVELFVYAPVGLLYEYEEVLPKLVRRGRSQVQLARVLGQMAVKRGQEESPEQLMGDLLTVGAKLVARGITEFGVAVGLAPDHPVAADSTDDETSDTRSDAAAADTGSAAPEHGTEDGISEAEERAAAKETAAAKDTAPAAKDTAPAAKDSAPAATGGLPIAGYDELTARAVIPLLDDLSERQREQVRRYETANRGRKTILAKLDRLGQG